jgi:hypothetical protein
MARPRCLVWAAGLALAACARAPSEPARSDAPLAVAPPASSASLERVLESIPDKGGYELDAATASRLVALSIACVDREYPYKPEVILEADAGWRSPKESHPAFHGCFDWHSAVHGHWAMVRVVKRYPAIPEAAAIRRALGAHLTEARIASELAFVSAERNKLFERPYGWAWLLRLAAELHGWDDPDAKAWESALRPLATLFARRTIDYLGRLSVPVRAGTHANTAFALAHVLDYARGSGDADLAGAVERAARTFYLEDADCPTRFEPSGEDFVSPCLAEADLMRRVLSPAELSGWLDRFLPPMASPAFRPLLAPPAVKDRHDPRIGHLIGLSLHRAWAMRAVARALAQGDARRAILLRAAALHRHDALEQMFDSGYGGAHWLASFAIYLLTDAGR